MLFRLSACVVAGQSLNLSYLRHNGLTGSSEGGGQGCSGATAILLCSGSGRCDFHRDRKGSTVLFRMRALHFVRCTSGAAVLEAAVVLPLAIALMVGGVEFGRAIFNYHTVDKSLRNATRYLAR